MDVESSGPIPGIHNLLSVGVVHVRKFQGRHQTFSDLYVELRPIFPGFEDAAMRVNRLDAVRLESEGLSPEAGMSKIVGWIQEQRQGKQQRPVFVAHNAPFDWMFFCYYCGHADVRNVFGYSALDTKALAMGKLSMPWIDTNLKNISAQVKVGSMDASARHHAGEDAKHLAKVFCALMDIPERAHEHS